MPVQVQTQRGILRYHMPVQIQSHRRIVVAYAASNSNPTCNTQILYASSYSASQTSSQTTSNRTSAAECFSQQPNTRSGLSSSQIPFPVSKSTPYTTSHVYASSSSNPTLDAQI